MARYRIGSGMTVSEVVKLVLSSVLVDLNALRYAGGSAAVPVDCHWGQRRWFRKQSVIIGVRDIDILI